MGEVFNFEQEIEKLEDQKWDILLRYGEHVAARKWIPIDARLNKLYVWWTNKLISEGRERELPFHRRVLK